MQKQNVNTQRTCLKWQNFKLLSLSFLFNISHSISGIRVSCNFCEEFRIADLAIILPSSNPDHHGNSQVEVSHSFLPERDFRCLEGAVHKKSVRRKVSD